MFTRRWVENINWRQSVPRLRGLELGLDSESWLSSQEVLFLTTLHKHWKRDPKKMSQTHYFHCKHADIHILYRSLSLFLSCVSPLCSGRRLCRIFLYSTSQCVIQEKKNHPDLCRSVTSAFKCVQSPDSVGWELLYFINVSPLTQTQRLIVRTHAISFFSHTQSFLFSPQLST